MNPVMKIVFDVTLNEKGHDLKYKCSKPYGMSLSKFDPKKSMGCLVLAFEHLAEVTGFCTDNQNDIQVKMFKSWIAEEKIKYGVK